MFTYVLVLIGFTPLLVRLVKAIGKDPEPSAARFKHISTSTAATGSLNVVEAEMEAARLAQMGLSIYDIFSDLFHNPGPYDKERFKKAETLEEECDRLKNSIKALRQKQTQIMHRNGDIDSGMMAIDLLNYLKTVNSDLFNIMQALCRRVTKIPQTAWVHSPCVLRESNFLCVDFRPRKSGILPQLSPFQSRMMPVSQTHPGICKSCARAGLSSDGGRVARSFTGSPTSRSRYFSGSFVRLPRGIFRKSRRRGRISSKRALASIRSTGKSCCAGCGMARLW